MSQIYRNMNRIGKVLFWKGSFFQIIGLIAVFFGDLSTKIPILGCVLLLIGIYFLMVCQFDERCNIKNNSKGESLPISPLEKVE